jgi:hypothetical protein
MARLLITEGFAALVVLTTLPVAVAMPQSGSAGRHVEATSQLSASAQVEDFELLRRALDEAHGGFDRFATRAEVHRRLDRHRASLDRPIDVVTFAGILSEAIAELRDGHARLELDSVTSARLSRAYVFPIRVALEGDRIVVRWNDAPGDTLLRPGMEIRRINRRPAAEIVSRLLPKVPGDGFVETGRRARLARELPALYWLHVDRSDRFTIEASDEAGRSVTVTLAGVRERERLANRNAVNERFAANLARLDGAPGNVTVELLADEVAHLRIRYFDGEGFPAALDSAFRLIRDRRIERLMLDLRGNGGGVDEYGALLVGQFTERPFRYFDRIRVTSIAPGFATWIDRTFAAMRTGTVPSPDGGYLVTPALHSGVGEQQPSASPYRGRLVVLVDGGTFSTAADVAAHLRSSGRALFVGEETGGTYEGNTSGLNALIVLPRSGLRTKVMMYGYWNAVAQPPVPGRGTLPDHMVTRRVVDVLGGVDPQRARALQLLD